MPHEERCEFYEVVAPAVVVLRGGRVGVAAKPFCGVFSAYAEESVTDIAKLRWDRRSSWHQGRCSQFSSRQAEAIDKIAPTLPFCQRLEIGYPKYRLAIALTSGRR